MYMKQNKLTNKKIIVTGASSGIGEQIARHVALNGGIPILLARSKEKLDNLQHSIKRDYHINSPVYQINLIDVQEVKKLADRIIKEQEQVHGLINNAGLGYFKYIIDTSWQETEEMLFLNVNSVIKLTQLFLPHFIEYGQGHIINIASQAGKIATPKSAVYAATKHAVIGYTNGLRLETKAHHVYVTSINLGPVKTNFFRKADPEGNYQKSVEKYMLDPDYVAGRVVGVLFKRKREINLPVWMEMGSKLYQLFPGLMERLLKKQFNKK
ncbi:SDR family oxidoreductase [Virgibacillus halodenitrificans]|uniref:SDR family NAD(P)-dependent oxidoreductase n=1 Tax=Virgibacillus halodenitrificans TaxID=1482 RepID=UPI0007615CA0|nr:SDR family oxidoreductase [Virgibacillus halodenitrificans]MCJ0930938.1 SDR family oxidoreductase [Virgibacillus halodenitrificans]